MSANNSIPSRSTAAEEMSTEAAAPVPVLAPGVAASSEFAHVLEMFESDRATAFLGVTITDLDLGHCAGEFTVRPEMCNGHDTCQGGFLYAFADSLFAGACNSYGDVAVAAHNSIHYLAPGFSGQRVEGVATTRQSWGRNGIVDVTLRADGRDIAEFRGTYRVIPGKPETRS